MHRTDVKPRAEVLGRDEDAWLDASTSIKVLGGLGFENAYALAMPRSARAGARHPHASPISPGARTTLSIAGDYEFFARPEWAALRKAYGLSFRDAAADAAGVHVLRPSRPARST